MAEEKKAPVTAQGGRIVKHTDAAMSIEALFANPESKARLARAVPRHMTADRLLGVALGAIRRTPNLLACSPSSLLNCFVQASQLGLEVGGALGHAYLVPFKDEATLIIGYKGLMDLARRSGVVSTIEAVAVFEGDTFRWERGLKPVLKHVPAAGADRSDPEKVTHVYGILRLRDGGTQFDVMTRDEVEAIQERSLAKDKGPWVTDWTAMALKTVLRRLLKFAPVSVEMQRAVTVDEEADAGIPQTFDLSPFEASEAATAVTPITVAPTPPTPVFPSAPPTGPGPDADAAQFAATAFDMFREKGRVGIVEAFEQGKGFLDALPNADRRGFEQVRLILCGAPKVEPFKTAGLKTFTADSDGYLTRKREGRHEAFDAKHGADFPPGDPTAPEWTARAWLFWSVHG